MESNPLSTRLPEVKDTVATFSNIEHLLIRALHFVNINAKKGGEVMFMFGNEQVSRNFQCTSVKYTGKRPFSGYLLSTRD